MKGSTPPIHRRTMDVKIYGLRLFGLWNEKSKYVQLLFHVGVFVNIVLLFVYLATVIVEIFLTDSNVIIFDCTLHVVTAIALLCKFYKFFFDHDRIDKLIEKIYKPLDILILSPDTQIQDIIQRNLHQEKILDIFFGCCFLIFDISVACVIFTEGKNLPLPGRFPFNTSISPLYEIIFSYHMWVTSLHLGVVLLVDELIFSSIRWITVQFIILNINYQNCCNTSYSKSEKNSDDSLVIVSVHNFTDLLKIHFQNHQYLIELVAEWNAIFNMTMFCEIATNCFMICLGSFQVTMGTSNLAYTAKFMFFFGAASCQLFIWCWLGSELTSQSELMASGLWSCGWESCLNSDIKSMMIMSMIHTKTILQLKAGKFFVMTMQTFVSNILLINFLNYRFLGFWAPESSTPLCTRFLYTINHILAVFFFSFYVATLIGDIVINRRNIPVTLEIILYLSSTLMVGFKSYKFAIEHLRIAHLTEAILKPLDALSQSEDSNIRELIKKNVLHEFIVDVSFGSMITLFDMGVLVMIYFNETDLLVRGEFPFDTTISPNHEYAIILQVFMIHVVFALIVLTDESIFSLIRWITIQLTILNMNYQKCNVSNKSIIDGYSSQEPIYENDDNFLFKLAICSNDHRYLIKLMSEWNSIFNTVMLTEISTNCFMICLTSVQLVMDHENMAETIKFMLFFGSAASQLLIWCWLGNELTFQSECVSNGLWSCGWEMYLKHRHIKSLMKISLVQGIRPFQMKAGKFFVMSMETYVNVIKTAYSFFAVLRATNV
ncbi:uncharacterized protein [Chelonus insularis]|uniref:uncharacterized protein n=1 Tax=Chelonus insularis TaxID=460826 RepID=UPI00158D45FB|nr:uncharacterized protein LOC118066240 [Chelonus insularis]